MNPQERDQLTQFLKQLAEARIGDKNAEAEALIQETVAKQPDAAYLLVQRAMLVEQALNHAKMQISQLQAQVQNAQAGRGNNGGFLGGGNPWAQSLDGGQASAGVPGGGSYQIPRSAPAVNAAPTAGGGVGSFLGNVATTAAGVVAGGFLFQGIENLLGGHHSSGFSAWGNDTPTEQITEQTVINNYYETPPDNDFTPSDDWSQADDMDDFLAQEGSDDSDWV